MASVEAWTESVGVSKRGSAHVFQGKGITRQGGKEQTA